MPLLPISGGLTISGSLTVSGSTLASGPISGSLIPFVSGSTTSSFSLGSAEAAWKDLWVSNGTIYFLGPNGQQQGTLSTTANGLELGNSRITGSLFQTPIVPRNINGSSSYFVAEVQGKPSIAFSIFNDFNTVNGILLADQSLVRSVLPFDKKYNAYFVMNNGFEGIHSATQSIVLSLPPWVNTRMAPGETVSVYNMSSGSNLLSNGKIYVVSTLQQVNAIGSATAPYIQRVTSVTNNGALLSGSWAPSGSGYTNINPTITPATSHSIALNPGQKATFELLIYPSPPGVTTVGYYGLEYPSTGAFDGTYRTNNADYLMGYRLVSIETL